MIVVREATLATSYVALVWIPYAYSNMHCRETERKHETPTKEKLMCEFSFFELQKCVRASTFLSSVSYRYSAVY